MMDLKVKHVHSFVREEHGRMGDHGTAADRGASTVDEVIAKYEGCRSTWLRASRSTDV